MTTGEVLENLRRDTENLHQGSGIPRIAKKGEYYLHAGESGRKPPESPFWPQHLKDAEKYSYAISAFAGGAVALENVRSRAGEVVGLAVNTDPQPAILPDSHFDFDTDFNRGRVQVAETEELAVDHVSADRLAVDALSKVFSHVPADLSAAA